MSPEQAEGNLEALGPRSDVYGMGATLFCLLTGRPPFEGELADVLRAVQNGEFPAPRKLDPSIDRPLEAICKRAMAHSPQDRYASPKALAEDLERWMADEPVSAWPEPLSRKARRWARRHRTGVTTAAAAVLFALAGTAAVLAVQTRANADLKTANASLAASNVRERARFALAQEAIRTFHTGVSQDVLLKQEEFIALRTKLLRGASEFYRKLEGLLQGQTDRDSRLSLGRAYYEVGELTRQLDSIEEANVVMRRAVDLFEALSRENPADEEPQRALALGLRSLATILNGVGRKDEEFVAEGRSRDLFRTLAEAHPGDRGLRGEWARSETLYGLGLRKQLRIGEALKAIERARAILEDPHREGSQAGELRARDGTRPAPSLSRGSVPATEGQQTGEFGLELMEIYDALASTLDECGRHDEALAAYAKACDLGEALFRAKQEDPTTSHELVRTLGNMGISLSHSGHRTEALAAYQRAREVLKAAGSANPTLIPFPAASAWIDSMLAVDLDKLGRDEEALEALLRARTAREILVKANPAVIRNREQLFLILHQTAAIHRRAHRMQEVLALLERAGEVGAGLVDSQPADPVYGINLSATYRDLGELHAAMGHLTSVLTCFDKAVAIARQLVASDPADQGFQERFADTLRRRGIALQQCRQPAQAAAAFREAITAQRGLKNPSPVDVYDLACLQSLLSGAAREAGSGLTAADVRAAAEEAMTTLHQAAAAGYRDANWLGEDPDLAAIRSRPDFQMLKLDMAFPADPFARRGQK
jgi:serine/threonine-protein kinase